jgi:hypothetical protein
MQDSIYTKCKLFQVLLWQLRIRSSCSENPHKDMRPNLKTNKCLPKIREHLREFLHSKALDHKGSLCKVR